MRIWGLLYLLSFSTGLMADDHLVYPMKKGNHWGLVNSKGNFKVAPNYDLYTAKEMKGIYALLKRTGESDSCELVVFDSLGRKILYNRDSIFLKTGTYKPRKGGDRLNKYVMKLCGYEPLTMTKSTGPTKPKPLYKQHEFNGFRRKPEGGRRHLEKIEEAQSGCILYKVTFGLARYKDIYTYAYLRKVSDSLYIANKGGQLKMLFTPGGTLGCVTVDDHEQYQELEGGYWGIVSVSGRIVEPFVHKDEGEVKAFGILKYGYRKEEASVLIIHSPLIDVRRGRRPLRKVKVLDGSGKSILEREGRGLESHEFGVFGRTVVQMESDDFKELYLINSEGLVQDTFEEISTNVYGHYAAFENGTWTLYDQYHKRVRLDLDLLTRQPEFLNHLYIKEHQGDSTRILNVFTNQARWVPAQKVFEFSGDFIKYMDAQGKYFIYSISLGRVMAEANNLDQIPLDELVWCTKSKGRRVIARSPRRYCGFPAYQNALNLDGYACLLNDSFILNQQGNLDTLLGGELVGGIGSLSVKDRAHYQGVSIYHKDYWLFNATVFTLTKPKNYALIDLKPCSVLRSQTIWFPKSNRLVVLKHFSFSDYFDFGGCLLVRGGSYKTKAKWLLFNEEGELIGIDRGRAPRLKEMDPKQVSSFVTAYQKKHRLKEERKYGY